MINPEFFRISQILHPFLSGLQPESPEMDTYNPVARMNQIYTPEHTASDRLMSLIDTMPQRQTPGIGQKILGSIAGLTGDPARVEHAMYGNYNRQLQDWQTRLNPMIQAANFERQGNINERMLANQIVSQEQRDRSLDRQINRDKTLEKQGQSRLDLATRRADQADERLAISKDVAKGGQLQFDKNGKGVILYKDGTTRPIKSELFSPQEKMELQQEYALERIGEQGKETRKTKSESTDASDWQIVPQYNAQGLPIGSLRVNRVTGEALPITVGEKKEPVINKGQSETQKARGTLERARQVKMSNPKMAPYITIKGQDFEIKRPNTFLPGGISEQEYNDLYKQIYGEGQAPAKQEVAKPDERIVVEKDGKRFSLPVHQLQQAISQGYKRVGQ